MSGGYFDYNQSRINDIADSIEKIISLEDIDDEHKHYFAYTETTLREFKNAVTALRLAAIYAQRVDWLVSGDDSEKCFHERLKEERDQISNDCTSGICKSVAFDNKVHFGTLMQDYNNLLAVSTSAVAALNSVVENNSDQTTLVTDALKKYEKFVEQL